MSEMIDADRCPCLAATAAATHDDERFDDGAEVRPHFARTCRTQNSRLLLIIID